MNKAQKIIDQLNFKPLNIFDNKQLTQQESDNNVDQWLCDTKISNINSQVSILSLYTTISIYVALDVECTNTIEWLKKINDINLKFYGYGIICYLDQTSNLIALKTDIINIDTPYIQNLIQSLNMIINNIPIIINELVSKK